MKNTVLTLLFLCIGLVGFAGNETTEKTSTKTVMGKITDASGESIAGAKIVIVQTGETFFADFDGNFKITLKTDKEYSISINTIGYEVIEKKASHLGTFSDFSLKAL